MDKITNENTFVGKHNLETIEDVLVFKVSLNKEIESWMNQRRSIYNKIKRTRDPNLKKQLEMDRDLVRLRFQLADGVAEAALTVSDAVLAAADETESLATTTAALTVVNATVQRG